MCVSVCVGVPVCAHTWVGGTWDYTRMCPWRSEVYVFIFNYCLYAVCWGRASKSKSDLSDMSGLTSQLALGIPCLCCLGLHACGFWGFNSGCPACAESSFTQLRLLTSLCEQFYNDLSNCFPPWSRLSTPISSVGGVQCLHISSHLSCSPITTSALILLYCCDLHVLRDWWCQMLTLALAFCVCVHSSSDLLVLCWLKTYSIDLHIKNI